MRSAFMLLFFHIIAYGIMPLASCGHILLGNWYHKPNSLFSLEKINWIFSQTATWNVEKFSIWYIDRFYWIHYTDFCISICLLKLQYKSTFTSISVLKWNEGSIWFFSWTTRNSILKLVELCHQIQFGINLFSLNSIIRCKKIE